jgi:hypothetical protein
MKTRYLTLGVLLTILAGCAAAPIRVNVPGFSIPTGHSANYICYAEIEESAPIRFKSVHYETTATFKPGTGLPSQEVDVVIYGRAEAPNGTCVEADETQDIALSDTIPISTTGTRVRVGGSRLASLVVREKYWIGASVAEDGLTIGSEIEFGEGTITARLF